MTPTRLGAGVCLAAGIADLLAINLWLGPKAIAEAAPEPAGAAPLVTSAAPIAPAPLATSAAPIAVAPPATSAAPIAVAPPAPSAPREPSGDAVVVVYFGFDSAVVPQASLEGLAALARRVNTTPGARLSIRAFADPSGGGRYNAALSDARARAVGEALQRIGVGANRMTAQGLGIAEEGADPSAHPRLRRADVVLSLGGGASR